MKTQADHTLPDLLKIRARCRAQLREARREADAAFDSACETLKAAVASGDRARVADATGLVNAALARCAELGLY